MDFPIAGCILPSNSRTASTAPAEGLTVLTYAVSEISHQGEPMDWVRNYGKGRVYTMMLGHTWKGEANPNLEDPKFRTLLAPGAEWAVTDRVTIPAPRGR